MPEWSRIAATSFGILFFVGHLIWAIYSLRFQSTREERLEAAGIVVPGLAGLLIAASAWVPPGYGWAVLSILIVAAVLIIVGRAIYELIVFGNRKRDG